MNIAIEQLRLDELKAFLREQAEDAFPDLKDGKRLNMLAEKWFVNAEFCTCRNAEGDLVGMISFYANQPEGGMVYIPHVYVNGFYRGQNLMSSMFNIIKGYVKEKGTFRYMCLEVQKDNERAQKAYTHYGFCPSTDASDKSFYMQCVI